MYKLVAFDLDGTLADTIPMCIKAFSISVSPYVGHELSEKEIMQVFGLNEIGMIKAVVKQDWINALENFYRNYEVLHSEVTELFPGILDLIFSLKKQNIIVALITGKGEKCCDITLEKLALADVFDEILYGSEMAPNKVENIEVLLRKYSLEKEEFCYIGDTVQDIKYCRKAGVTCFSAAWQKMSDPAKLEIENPNHVLYNVNEIGNMICNKEPI